ncbi:hypothetical protein D3C87_762580 [compost metagenome]
MSINPIDSLSVRTNREPRNPVSFRQNSFDDTAYSYANNLSMVPGVRIVDLDSLNVDSNEVTTLIPGIVNGRGGLSPSFTDRDLEGEVIDVTLGNNERLLSVNPVISVPQADNLDSTIILPGQMTFNRDVDGLVDASSLSLRNVSPIISDRLSSPRNTLVSLSPIISDRLSSPNRLSSPRNTLVSLSPIIPDRLSFSDIPSQVILPSGSTMPVYNSSVQRIQDDIVNANELTRDLNGDISIENPFVDALEVAQYSRGTYVPGVTLGVERPSVNPVTTPRPYGPIPTGISDLQNLPEPEYLNLPDTSDQNIVYNLDNVNILNPSNVSYNVPRRTGLTLGEVSSNVRVQAPTSNITGIRVQPINVTPMRQIPLNVTPMRQIPLNVQPLNNTLNVQPLNNTLNVQPLNVISTRQENINTLRTQPNIIVQSRNYNERFQPIGINNQLQRIPSSTLTVSSISPSRNDTNRIIPKNVTAFPLQRQASTPQRMPISSAQEGFQQQNILPRSINRIDMQYPITQVPYPQAITQIARQTQNILPMPSVGSQPVYVPYNSSNKGYKLPSPVGNVQRTPVQQTIVNATSVPSYVGNVTYVDSSGRISTPSPSTIDPNMYVVQYVSTKSPARTKASTTRYEDLDHSVFQPSRSVYEAEQLANVSPGKSINERQMSSINIPGYQPSAPSGRTPLAEIAKQQVLARTGAGGQAGMVRAVQEAPAKKGRRKANKTTTIEDLQQQLAAVSLAGGSGLPVASQSPYNTGTSMYGGSTSTSGSSPGGYTRDTASAAIGASRPQQQVSISNSDRDIIINGTEKTINSSGRDYLKQGAPEVTREFFDLNRNTMIDIFIRYTIDQSYGPSVSKEIKDAIAAQIIPIAIADRSKFRYENLL